MDHDDARIESLLGRYHPVDPPPALRQRALGAAEAYDRRLHLWRTIGWSVLAAMLILSVGLHWATLSIEQQTIAMLGSEPIQWSAQAEELAQLLNGQGAGRRYLALQLASGNLLQHIISPLEQTNLTGDLP